MSASDWSALGSAVAVLGAAWMVTRAIWRFLVGIRDNTRATLELAREFRELRQMVQRHENEIRELQRQMNGTSPRRR